MHIIVRTFTMSDMKQESEKVINHDKHEDRKWLAKHCFWAMRNGRGVQTNNVKDEPK